jgi:penicillin-binding protein 2
MYDLLTAAARSQLPRSQFWALYQNTQREMTTIQLEAHLNSLLGNGPQASAVFHSRRKTALFGEIEADHTVTLLYETGRWGIEWQPGLILPDLRQGQTLAFLDEVPVRGNIYDRNAHALAAQGQVVAIGVIPRFAEDIDQLLVRLEAITGQRQDVMRLKIESAQPDWFVPIANVSFETSIAFDDELTTLPGVERRAEMLRTYSEGELAAHLIGYVGSIPVEAVAEYQAQGYQGNETVGLAGVEGWGEAFLAGRRGGRLVILSPAQSLVSELASALPRPGGSIYLSLDTALQAQAERILGAQPGAIVVSDPNTGFILAMASWPRFAPEQFAAGISQASWLALLRDALQPLVNRATQGTYPPGSVFKVVSATAAMVHLGYTAQTSFFCSGSWDGLGPNFVKKCWLETGHGQIDLLNGLIQSCDVVFYEIALALHQADPAFLPNMARTFGLGAPTGLAVASEAAGVVPDEAWKQANLGETFYEGDAVNMGIGQGFLVATPLQIANILAAVGNGGFLYRPQLITRFNNRASGDQYLSPEVVRTLPFTPDILATLRQALTGVVSAPRGTARQVFAGWAYTAAGKTGTSETGVDAPHAWFAGYAPADTPRVAITVILEHAGEGSEKAAPLFRSMAEAYFAWEAETA